MHGSLGVWEPLIILDNNMMAQPVLATSWESSPDGKVWTIRLRQGVQFHDGTPFEAEAVLLNIPKLQDEYMTTLPNLASLEKVDAHTVRFIMEEPTPNFPQLIAYFSSAMLSPNAVGEDGRPTAPLGTGHQQEWLQALYRQFKGQPPPAPAHLGLFYPVLIEMGIYADVEILWNSANYVYESEDELVAWWSHRLELGEGEETALRAPLLAQARPLGQQITIPGRQRVALIHIDRSRSLF